MTINKTTQYTTDPNTIPVDTSTGSQTIVQALDQRGPVFDTVADMDAATNLTVGVKCRTLGYYSSGDGGGNDYEIVPSSTGTGDGGSFIDLSGSGLQAKGLFTRGILIDQFGAVGNGVSDDTAPMQSAVNYASGDNLILSSKDYLVSSVSLTNLIRISGTSISAGGGTRVLASSNSAVFDVSTNGVSIDNISFIGQGVAGNTLQAGIKVTSVNNVRIEKCFFSDLYDSIHIFGECFYTEIHDCFFSNNIRAHVYAEGNTGPGNDTRITNCRCVPNSGQYGFFFKNYGSVVIDSVVMSPNNLTQNTVLMDTPSSAAGVQQFTECVFEGSQGAAFRAIGAGSGLDRAKFFMFSNCYFGNSGPSPCIDLTNVRSAQFNGGYVTNGSGQALIFLSGDTRDITISDAEMQGTGIGILADTGGTVDGLYVTNVMYDAASKFINLAGASTRTRVSVSGGRLGTNSVPVDPPGIAEMIVSVPNDTKYKNSGIASFDGGGSLFTISTGLVRAPSKFSVVPNSIDAGEAEIREVTISGNDISVQCKNAATSGTQNVKWAWYAE